LISFKDISPDRLERIKEICRKGHVSLRQAQIRIETIDVD